jgi:hypothetical protein
LPSLANFFGVVVIPLLLKRGGGLCPTGYLKAVAVFLFVVVVVVRSRPPFGGHRATPDKNHNKPPPLVILRGAKRKRRIPQSRLPLCRCRGRGLSFCGHAQNPSVPFTALPWSWSLIPLLGSDEVRRRLAKQEGYLKAVVFFLFVVVVACHSALAKRHAPNPSKPFTILPLLWSFYSFIDNERFGRKRKYYKSPIDNGRFVMWDKKQKGISVSGLPWWTKSTHAIDYHDHDHDK